MDPKQWTPREKDLFMFLETQIVDGGGIVKTHLLKGDELDLIKKMESLSLITYENLHYGMFSRGEGSIVIFSTRAWEISAELRREKGERTKDIKLDLFSKEFNWKPKGFSGGIISSNEEDR